MMVREAAVMGFCGGVRAAIRKAEEAAAMASRLSLPCYVYGDIVHSAVVMDGLAKLGIKRIDSASFPPGVVVIRTHGISDAMRSEFQERGFVIVDATCPVVLGNQEQVRSASSPVLVIGKAGHAEIVSVMGASGKTVLIENAADLSSLDASLRYEAVVQTTLPEKRLAEIKEEAERLGLDISFISTICAASVERRKALAELCGEVDAVVVVGDRRSANTSELKALAERMGKPAFLVESADDIPRSVMSCGIIGLTAGASAPDTLIESVRRRLADGR